MVEVARYFTRSDGSYLFARWNRPIAPVVFGVEDETLSVMKGALEAVCALAGHQMTETDPELGANFMVFFLRDWDELTETPNLDRLIPELRPLVGRLKDAGANQYRLFRFDPDGGIRACFIFVRMDDVMSDIPAETICLGQAVQSILLWSDEAFLGSSPLALTESGAMLKPEIAAIIRAGYDRAMPMTANDPAHALRLQARIAS